MTITKLNILTKHKTADVPHVADNRLWLDQLLDDWPDDDQQVVCADHHIPDDNDILWLVIRVYQKNTFSKIK